MTDLSKHIIDKINAEHIRPLSKWVYIASNILFWIVFLVALLFGAQCVAMILLVVLDTDVAALLLRSVREFDLMLEVLPLVWVLFMMLFLYLAYIGLHHTQRGYKISFSVLLLGNLALSAAGGTLLYVSQIPHIMDVYLDSVPFYQTLEERRQQIWSHPVRGLLGGMIMTGENEEDWILEDFHGKLWSLQFARSMPQPRDHTLVRVEGRILSEEVFQVERMKPLRGQPLPLLHQR